MSRSDCWNRVFPTPRGTRDSVIVVIIVIRYLALKLIHWLVFIFCSWAVFFVWNPIITTQRYYIQKSNIQHWDQNSNFHFKPSKRCTQRSYREIGPGAGILTTRRIFLARPQACRSSILMISFRFTPKNLTDFSKNHKKSKK